MTEDIIKEMVAEQLQKELNAQMREFKIQCLQEAES
jgi:hypothetical protein